jgi:DNA-binding SARP family transcriptional activator
VHAGYERGVIGDMTTYHLLGQLAVRDGEIDRTPRGPKIGKVLALLLLRAGEVVSVRTLAEELWDDRPPRTAVTTIRTHVYHLRKSLGGTEAGAAALSTEPTGYRFVRLPGPLDAHHFVQSTERGHALLTRPAGSASSAGCHPPVLRSGAAAEASAVLADALDMWRGAALAGIEPGPVLTRHAEHLEELRVRALELRIEADMALGRHRQLLPELRGLVAAHPLNEWFHARLIDALHRSGRRGDALQAYGAVRGILDRELGVEPSADLRRVQHEVLTAGRVAS